MEYVYIFSNPELKGIIKIGRTKTHPELRANQLNRNTGTFGKYQVDWFKEVPNSTITEKVLHYVFRHFHTQKEFFSIEVSFAIKIAEKAISKIEESDTDVMSDLDNQIQRIQKIVKAMKIAKKYSDEKALIRINETIIKYESQLKKLDEIKEVKKKTEANKG